MNYRSQDPMTLNAHDCERMAYAAGDAWVAGILARLADTEDEMLIERDRYGNADLDKLERIEEMHHRLIKMLDQAIPYIKASYRQGADYTADSVRKLLIETMSLAE